MPAAPPELNVTYPTTYSGDVTDPAAAQPLDLKEGTATELHFHLHAVPSVALALKAPEDPSSGITAYLIGSGPEGIQVNSLQEGDPLQMIGLAPGHYELIARFGTKTVRREIDLAASTTMDLSPDESVKCTGRITAETPDSAPVGAGIVLVGRGSAHPGRPEPEGISFYSVPPGRYQVFLTNAPQFYTKAVSLNGKQVTGNDIDIPASGGFEISVLAAHVAVEKLEGVVEKDGTPAAAMMVLLVPEDLSRSSLIRRDQSDSDGSFSLRSVAPGRYTLIAIDGDPELAYRDPAVIKPYLAHGQMVNITPGFNEHLKIEVYRRP
ncbi:MAG: carboxypeptidase regulatory-like domain-containing protein [Acidobacteriaceae bacterium]|nr:carboxypeptidase regulatory-like domain-containing protein [Acidobacteriaceae bacterium]